jgi:type IV pilus assembly protein PilP
MMAKRWMLVPVVLLLAGCGTDEFDDLHKFVEESGKDMRGNIEKPPEIKPYEPFNYRNPDLLPDPFKPRKPEGPKNVVSTGGPPKHDAEDLEGYPLESLKMIGYLKINGTANAMIASPDGKVHHVHAGNYMGQNFGLIESINESEVRLKEKVLDSNGAWSDRNSSLQLQE